MHGILEYENWNVEEVECYHRKNYYYLRVLCITPI